MSVEKKQDTNQVVIDTAKLAKDIQAPKWSKEELLQVFDELMFSGEYKEEITIKNKLKITFRSRTAEETVAISKKLDDSRYNLITTVQEQRALLNLAASLVAYGPRDLAPLKEEERLNFIRKLPVSIVSSLSDLLSNFDRKVEAACSEAEENF